MDSIKNILSLILIVTVIASGLPFYSLCDTTRDSTVNLEDLIVNVRNFADTVDNPALFTSKLKKAITSLNIVAGLETELSPHRETQKTTNTPLINPAYILSASAVIKASDYNTFQITEKAVIYKSLSILPDTPPPRSV